MTTTVRIDLNDQGATTTLAALAAKFGSTGAAADKMGGSIAGVEGRLSKASAAAKKIGGDIGASTAKTDGMADSFRRLALSGGAWQALTYGVQKFNESTKAAAAEGVEPLELSVDRLIKRIVEGQGVFSKLSSIFGKGLGSSIFEDEEKEKRLDKTIAGMQKRREIQDKIISDNANRYADTEYAVQQRLAAQTEQDAAKKIKSIGDIDAAEKLVLATMKRQREEADQNAVRDSFDAKTIEEANKAKDRARAEGEMKLQTLFARRMELEAQHQEQLKTEIDRIREIIETEEEHGDASFSRIQELKAKEADLNRQRKDQMAVIRELADIDHRKRMKQIEDEAARQREFFNQHKELWQQQQERENGKRQNRIDAIAQAFRGQQQPGGPMQMGGGPQQRPQGGQMPNPVQQFIDALNPREVRRRVLEAKMEELNAGREGRLAGLGGRDRAAEERRIAQQERFIRRDAARGVVGGRGGIDQGDVAKALQDEANARIGVLDQQKKLNGDIIEGFRDAVQAQLAGANVMVQQAQLVAQLQKQLDVAMRLIQQADRIKAQPRNR